MIEVMRTTLEIDNDVLEAAREIARRQKKTIGEVMSGLARKALTAIPDRVAGEQPENTFGFRAFPSRGGLVTNEMIDRLKNEEGE